MRGYSIVTLSQPPVPTYPPGRVCASEGCGTRLSVYNSGRFCCLHEGPDEYGGAPVRICIACHEPKPLTEEFWYCDRDRRDGWKHTCRQCLIERERARRATRRGRPPSAAVKCRQCGQVKPRDGEHWSFGHNRRLVQPCLDCQEANKERRDGAALDYYYRKKYGCTRDEYLARDGSCHAVIVIGKGGCERVMEVASEGCATMATTEGARRANVRPRGHYLNGQV